MIKLKELHQLDEWGRPLYKDIEGNYYCDVNLGSPDRPIHICYKSGKESEPYFTIKNFEIIDDTH
jgi:hypothetical protein